MSSFSFQGITMTPALPTATNLRLAAEWTAADPDHRETTHPYFWLEQRYGTDSYLFEDEKGAILFFKMVHLLGTGPEARVVEMHIQFAPAGEDVAQESERRRRTAHCMCQGFHLLEAVLAARGIDRVCFTSKNPALIRFCRKRLGFETVPERSNGVTYLEKRIGLGVVTAWAGAMGNER
jgi:hypothetical protein